MIGKVSRSPISIAVAERCQFVYELSKSKHSFALSDLVHIDTLKEISRPSCDHGGGSVQTKFRRTHIASDNLPVSECGAIASG